MIVILLTQILAFLAVFVAKVYDVIGSSSLIRVSNFILFRHVLDPTALALLFVFHVLPSFEIALVFLNTEKS